MFESKQALVGHPNLILETLKDVLDEKGFHFRSTPKELHGGNEWNSIHCAIDSKELGANFDLQQCPGCCAVLTVSYVRVDPWSFESFNYVLELIEEAAFKAGFGSVMMTQVVPAYSKMLWKQEAWIKCLDRKWVASPAFRNAKSGNLVVYLTKDLEQKGKKQGLEFKIEEERQ